MDDIDYCDDCNQIFDECECDDDDLDDSEYYEIVGEDLKDEGFDEDFIDASIDDMKDDQKH